MLNSICHGREHGPWQEFPAESSFTLRSETAEDGKSLTPAMIAVRCWVVDACLRLNTRLRSTPDPLIARRSTALESMVDRSQLEATIGRDGRPLAQSG